jgi:hypothetical protein
MAARTGMRVDPYEIEPLCGRKRNGSAQAKSRGKRGIAC